MYLLYTVLVLISHSREAHLPHTSPSFLFKHFHLHYSPAIFLQHMCSNILKSPSTDDASSSLQCFQMKQIYLKFQNYDPHMR